MTLLNGVNHRTTSVYSIHYYGSANTGTTSDVIPKGAPYTNASSELFPLSYGFDNKSSVQTWQELMKFSYTPYPVIYQGNVGFVVSTVYNKFFVGAKDLAEYGALYNPDESKDRMDGWIGATTGPHAIEYVRPFKEVGLFELPEHIPDYSRFGMTDVQVPIKSLKGLVPINEVGKYISRIATLEADFRDVLFGRFGFNPETEAFLEFSMDKGLGPAREIEAIGVGNLENAIASTRFFDDGSVALVASKDMYQKALNIAHSYGLKGDEAVRFVKRAIWYHELYHVLDHRNGLSKRRREIDAGEFLAKFFGARAPMLERKIARYYRALERYNRDYAQHYRERGIQSLIGKYAAEAEEKGLKGEEAQAYIASKLEEEAEGLEHNSSGDEGGGSKVENRKDGKKAEYSKRKTSNEEASDDAENAPESGERDIGDVAEEALAEAA